MASTESKVLLLVLSVDQVREHDLEIRGLSPDSGMKTLRASHALHRTSRYTLAIDRLSLVDASVTRAGSLLKLKEATIIESFLGISSSLERSAGAAVMTELLVRCPFEIADSRLLFANTLRLLRAANSQARNHAMDVLDMTASTLTCLGILYWPTTCPKCPADHPLLQASMNLQSGEVTCRHHADTGHWVRHLSEPLTQAIKTASSPFNSEAARPDVDGTSALFDACDVLLDLFECQFGKLRTRSFLTRLR